MFKNLVLFRITTEWQQDAADVESALDSNRFHPCAATQLESSGWIEPRGEKHGALLEIQGGHWMAKFCVEKKVIPGNVVKRAVEERVAQIEEEEGRKPGKKEKREIKDEVIQNLLPSAFTKMETISVWIDTNNKMLIVDGSSIKKSDGVASALVDCLDGFGLQLVNTQKSPMQVMSHWLMEGEATDSFSIEREVELKSLAEDKAVVKYARHDLAIEEIKRHIAGGKVPVKLAMSWNDRVSFMLTDTGVIKKIAFMETAMEDGASDKDDPFDANFAILTGEMEQMIPELINSLGGEMAV